MESVCLGGCLCLGELNAAPSLLKSGWLALDYLHTSILIRAVTGFAFAVVASSVW